MAERRPATELVVLILATGVVLMLLIATATVAVIEIRDPSVDTSGTVESVEGILGVIVGLVAGFVTGRAGLASRDTAPVRPVEPRSEGETHGDSPERPGAS